mgnify:CR=1 FL=1
MGEAKIRKKEIEMLKSRSKGLELANLNSTPEELETKLTEIGSGVVRNITHPFGDYIKNGLPAAETRNNRCYDLTRWLKSQIPGTTWASWQCNVIDGEVRMTKYADNIRSGHSWIEFIDGENEFCFDVVQAITAEKNDYYRAFDITNAKVV